MNSKLYPESLDDLLLQGQRYSDHSMRNQGHVPGTLLLLGPSGPALYVPPRLDDEFAKDHFAATARQLAIAHEASAIVMVLEAWACVAAPGQSLDASLPPSQSPDRREVVVLIGETAGVQQTRFLPILRSANGTFSGFAPAQSMTCSRAEGRFAQILPTQPPTPEEKARAAAILQAEGINKKLTSAKHNPRPRRAHWH